MSWEHQEKFYFKNTNRYSPSIDSWQKFQHDGHVWTFDAKVEDDLKITLTYKGRSTGSEQAVEVFGRIYILDQNDCATSLSYWIPHTMLNLVSSEFIVEEMNVYHKFAPFVISNELRFRLQIFFTRTTIVVDFKLLKPYTNIAIIVGETKFFVSKEILAAVSPVFSSLFEGGNNKNEIKVDNVTSDEFEELLKIIHPGSRVEISLERAPGVLKVAHEYRMESVLAICEMRLMFLCNGKMASGDRKKYFSLACECGLLGLQYNFIKTCSAADLQAFINDIATDKNLVEVLKMAMLRVLSYRGVSGAGEWERRLALTTDLKPAVIQDNLTIVIKDTKLYVSKEVLATASPVFATMFFGDFKEKKKNEIELDDVASDDFDFLLKLLEPGSRATVTDRSVMGVLKLADKYLIETIVDICDEFLAEEFLEKHSLMESHMYLVVASQYRLRRLQSVFASSCNPQDLAQLFELGLFDSLTPDVIKMLLDGVWPSAGPEAKTWSFRDVNIS